MVRYVIIWVEVNALYLELNQMKFLYLLKLMKVNGIMTLIFQFVMILLAVNVIKTLIMNIIVVAIAAYMMNIIMNL